MNLSIYFKQFNLDARYRLPEFGITTRLELLVRQSQTNISRVTHND